MTNEMKNMPELRFPEFEGNWLSYALKDVKDPKDKYSFAGGPFGSDLKKSDYKDNGIRIIQLQNINDGNFNDNYKIYTSSEKADILKSCNIYPGDIVIAKMADPLARATILPQNKENRYLMASDAIRLKVDDKRFNKIFMVNYINSRRFRRQAEDNSSGSTRMRIGLVTLGQLKISSPNKKEQDIIGDFFSKLDQQIELEEKKLAKLEEQKKGYMQQIFSQELRFKEDNENSYPEWESAPLFDIFTATKGKSLSKDKISNDGKYECILYGEIYTTYAEKIESIVSRTNYYEGILSQKNDLIFPNSTTTNSWDLATFSSLQKNNVLIGGDISILRTKRSDISSLFYAYYLTNYLKLRKDIAKYAQGITIVHLSFNNFYKIKVQIPSLEEQNSITDFIDSLNQQQKLIANKIKLLKERKKGFLQKMFV